MSGLDDLGRALRDDAAANAPRASAIDVDAVARAARARRRPRVLGVGALAIVGALGLGGLAVGALAPPALIAASESQSSTADAPLADGGDLESGELEGGELEGGELEGGDLEALDGGGSPARADDPFGCGASTPAVALTDDRIRLAIDLTTSVLSGADQTGDEPVGSLRLINTTGAELAVQSRPEAFAVLVHDGVVVGQSSVVSDVGLMGVLDPGVSLDLVVRVLTVSCVDGSALPPGDYTVLAGADVGIDGEPPVRLTAAPVPVRID